MNGRHTAQEAAALLGVSPATIRSWVHRGHLRPGRLVRGTATWTEGQLRAALAKDDHATAPEGSAPTLDPTVAMCRCGEPPQMEVVDDWARLSCSACRTSMAVRALPRMPAPLRVERPFDPLEEKLRQLATWALAARRTGQPSVYFIRLGVYMKIGTTIDVARRVTSLSLGRDHLKAVIPGGADVEREHHRRFAALRAWGEWFNYEAELEDYVEALRREELRRQHPDAPGVSA